VKLLFDQNLSPKLVSRLAEIFPSSNHVYLIGLDTASDRAIRSFAAENDFVIVTKDADYAELLTLYGGPPGIVWIRRGNCSTPNIATLLADHLEQIESLTGDSTTQIITIF